MSDSVIDKIIPQLSIDVDLEDGNQVYVYIGLAPKTVTLNKQLEVNADGLEFANYNLDEETFAQNILTMLSEAVPNGLKGLSVINFSFTDNLLRPGATGSVTYTADDIGMIGVLYTVNHAIVNNMVERLSRHTEGLEEETLCKVLEVATDFCIPATQVFSKAVVEVLKQQVIEALPDVENEEPPKAIED